MNHSDLLGKAGSQLLISRIIMLASSAVLLYWIKTATATSDWGDGITHYEIAVWSWENPILLLDHWGKPFFTLLVSPFAQGGMQAAWFFNGLCFIGAAWLVQRICEDEWKSLAPFPFLLVLFAPICFDQYFAVLTECLFGLILAASIRLIQLKRLAWAALLLSFLPFVRTEGFILFLAIAPLFILKRAIFSFCLLCTGTLVYTIIGGFVFDDFLWIVHNNPYKAGPSVYGKGPWMHFVGHAEIMFGLVATIGLYAVPLALFLRNKNNPKLSMPLLISGLFFFLYFLLHTIFWGLGINGSAGLIRVMTAVVPCVAILCSFSYKTLLQSVKIRGAVLFSVLSLLGLYSSVHAVSRRKPPQKPDGVLTLCSEVANYIKNIPDWQQYRLVTQFPPIRVMLDKNPYDSNESLQISGLDKANPELTLKDKDLIVYDTHFTFGLNRPLEQFNALPNCNLLREFSSKESYVKLYVLEYHEK